jgi:predicted transcriptional regulator
MTSNRVIHPIQVRQENGRLRKEDGLTVPEIAAKLKFTQPAVRAVLSSLAQASEPRSRRIRDINTTPRKCLSFNF